MEENRTEPAAPHAGDPSQETAAARGPRGGNGPESVSDRAALPPQGSRMSFRSRGRPLPEGETDRLRKGRECRTGRSGPESAVRRRFPTTGDLFAMLGIALGAQALVGLFRSAVLALRRTRGELQHDGACGFGPAGRRALLRFDGRGARRTPLLPSRARRARALGPFLDTGLNPALLLWAFVMMCAVGVVLEPLLALLPELQINVGRGFWTILSLVLFAPVFEELICRGVVLGSLRSRYGVTIAWLVSSLFFGILHGQPVQVVNAFVVGLVLGYVYIATDSLWAAMILHALNNAVAYLMLVTGHANTLLIDLIPGRTLYVAVYVVALAVLVVSGYMMWRALRRMKEAEKNRAGRNNPPHRCVNYG